MNYFRSKYEQTSKIRVLIANPNGLVAELIAQTIQQQPDIELLGSVESWDDVKALISKATIFIISCEDETFSSETCLSLLNEQPQLKILILSVDSDAGTVYWRSLHCQQMQIISAQTLIESIRYVHSLLFKDMCQCSSFAERN